VNPGNPAAGCGRASRSLDSPTLCRACASSSGRDRCIDKHVGCVMVFAEVSMYTEAAQGLFDTVEAAREWAFQVVKGKSFMSIRLVIFDKLPDGRFQLNKEHWIH